VIARSAIISSEIFIGDSALVSHRLTGLIEVLFTVDCSLAIIINIDCSFEMDARWKFTFVSAQPNETLSFRRSAVIGIHAANALSIVYNTSINPLSRLAACNRKKNPPWKYLEIILIAARSRFHAAGIRGNPRDNGDEFERQWRNKVIHFTLRVIGDRRLNVPFAQSSSLAFARYSASSAILLAPMTF